MTEQKRPKFAAIVDARTGVKIASLVVVLAAAAMVVGGVAISSLAKVYDKGQLIATKSLQATADLATLRDLAQQSRIQARDAVLAPDLPATKKVEAKMPWRKPNSAWVYSQSWHSEKNTPSPMVNHSAVLAPSFLPSSSS